MDIKNYGYSDHEALKEDFKEAVMNYPAGCTDGKMEFLRSLGYEFMPSHYYGGTVTVTIPIQEGYYLYPDRVLEAIKNILGEDATLHKEITFSHDEG